jgi:1-phosphofructokinase family hexose kinase
VDPTIYRELTEVLRSRGQKVVLDTSGEPLRHAMQAVPDVIKPNIHELEEMLGRTLDSRERVVEAARELIKRGTSLVAVSMGADGALFVTASEVVAARPPDIVVRSTVGAGDAMVAGIVAGQLRGLSLFDCARLATAFSLDALERGESGVSSHAAIEAFMQKVTIS